MAYLRQGSASVNTCSQFTFSSWVRINSELLDDPNSNITLFEFGESAAPSADPPGFSSHIVANASTFPSTSHGIGVQLAGGRSTYDITSGIFQLTEPRTPVCDLRIDADTNGDFTPIPGLTPRTDTFSHHPDVWLCPPDTYTDGYVVGIFINNLISSTMTWHVNTPTTFYFTSGLRVNTSDGSAQLSPSEWHHLFVAADLSSGFTNTTAPNYSTNNDNMLLYPAAYMNTLKIYIDGASAGDYSAGLFTSDDSDNSNSFLTTDASPDGQAPGGFLMHSNSSSNVSANESGSGEALVGEIALPGFRFNDGTDPEASTLVEYAYTQVWFDQYIEPNGDNLSKFFRRSGGRLVPPTNKNAAQDAFGPSHIWFRRDKASGLRYQVNGGVGGGFDVIGTTPVDYVPGPGQ